MKLLKGLGEFFALDIGSQSIRIVELARESHGRWRLAHIGYSSVDPKLVASDTDAGRKKLASAIVATVGQAEIKAKDVVIALPSAKTFTTIIDMPKMTDQELTSTLKYQADRYTPMPLENTKYDWAVLGQSPDDAAMQSVLIASTAQNYIEQAVDTIDGLGFNVVAAEPAPIAMVRSLLPPSAKGAHIIITIGELATDIIVTVDEQPVLVRSLPMGLQGMMNALVQNLSVGTDQAKQFILKFGLAQDRLEGQVVRSLQAVLDSFAAEITKSVRFYQNKYGQTEIAALHLSGYGGVIPLFREYLGARLGVAAEVTSPWQRVDIPEALQTKVLPVEYEFSAAVGLCMRESAA